MTSYDAAADNGTHIGGPIRTGSYFDGQAGPGVLTSPVYVYDIVPALVTTNSIVTSVMPAAGGYLTLAGGSGSVTITTFLGLRVAQLDVPRVVTITSSGNDSAINFTVYGYDYLGKPMVELIAGPNTTTVSGDKAFAYVSYVYCAAATAGNITVGTGNTFGLPYVSTAATEIIAQWDLGTTSGARFGTATLGGGTGSATVSTTAVNSDSVIFVSRQAPGAGALGNLSIPTITPATSFVIDSDNNADVSVVAWQIASPQARLTPADATDPATSTTGDVRGTVTPYTTANGGRRLAVYMYLPQSIASPDDQTFASYYGVDQYTQALI